MEFASRSEEMRFLRSRLNRLENALLAIKHMDVLTREGEAQPHEVMRQIATDALA